MTARAPLPLGSGFPRSLLGGGTAYLVLFVAVHAVLAAGPAFWSLSDLALLALVAGAQLVLVLRRTSLSSALAAVICGATVLTAAIGLASLPAGSGGDSYSAWFLGAIAFDLLGLTLAGRFAAAWATMLVVVGMAIGWSALVGDGAASGIGLVVRHVGTLLVGTALAASLRRSAALSAVSRAAERARRAEERAAQASTVARRAAVERVLAQVAPTLQGIADGRPLTEGDRRELLVLEGSLRDGIRTPDLVLGRLRESVDAARRRGVNVLLMDEAASGRHGPRTAAAEWLADRLDEVPAGGFVGRLRELDGALRASVVAGGTGRAATFDAVPAPR